MLGQHFVDRYCEVSRMKNSFLCVGLDPASSSIRDRYIIPKKMEGKFGLSEAIKQFCIGIVKTVAPYTPIIKPNSQFITYPLSFDTLKELVDCIHEENCLALLDCKLSDIGSTNRAGLHWIDKLGFDAITFSPFPGFKNGSDAIYDWALKRNKGIFTLCRMSNPGAMDYQSLKLGDEALYLKIARDACERGCNGFVVGCTAPSEIGDVRSIVGEERLILSPGLGVQDGDPGKALKFGANKVGERLIVSSSRSINYAYETLGWSGDRFAEAAALIAKRKRDDLNEIRNRVFHK